jgi:hypothetical protein
MRVERLFFLLEVNVTPNSTGVSCTHRTFRILQFWFCNFDRPHRGLIRRPPQCSSAFLVTDELQDLADEYQTLRLLRLAGELNLASSSPLRRPNHRFNEHKLSGRLPTAGALCD